MLELAVDALNLAHTPGSDLPEYEDLRERYLPEVEFRGRTEHRNTTPQPIAELIAQRHTSAA